MRQSMFSTDMGGSGLLRFARNDGGVYFIRMRQIAIDLIGADVVQAKSRFARRIQAQPIGARRF